MFERDAATAPETAWPMGCNSGCGMNEDCVVEVSMLWTGDVNGYK